MKIRLLILSCLITIFLGVMPHAKATCPDVVQEPFWWKRFVSLDVIQPLLGNNNFTCWKQNILSNQVVELYLRTYGIEDTLLALLANWASLPQWEELRAQASANGYNTEFSSTSALTPTELRSLILRGGGSVAVMDDITWLETAASSTIKTVFDHPCQSKVRDQGVCNACWAFAMADLLTLSNCAYNYTTPQQLAQPFSESAKYHASIQQLIDCVRSERGPASYKDLNTWNPTIAAFEWDNAGCHLGTIREPATYIRGQSIALGIMGGGATIGVMDEASYPLDMVSVKSSGAGWFIRTREWDPINGQCKFVQSEAKFGVANPGLSPLQPMHVSVVDYNEVQIKVIMSYINNAVVTGIYSNTLMYLYKGGLFADTSANGCLKPNPPLNHFLLIVGYSYMNPQQMSLPYWKIKNTWGTTWGQNGYMFLLRNETNTVSPNTSAQYFGEAMCSIGHNVAVVWPPWEIPPLTEVKGIGYNCMTFNV